MSDTRPKARHGLVARLLAAQLLVVVAGAVTAWVVAVVVGPPLFDDHLERAGGVDSGEAAQHAAEAFRSASVISFSVALLAALAAALTVSVYLTRRIGRPVAAVSAAAATVAGGHYAVRLPTPGIGHEFASLSQAFNQMADQLDKVESTRRRMLADLAHELRTPVATIDAYLEGLEDGVATLDEPTVRLLHAQTARLSRLAADVAAVSQAEEGQLKLRREPVTVQELALSASSGLAERYAAADVRLLLDAPEALPALDVDPERLAQVLGNLLDNALRHTPPGGRVRVAAAAAGSSVRLTVSDTGSGIPPESLPHVFERFYRVDSARDRDHGGSGIGLAIAKALVEAHGGRITAQSDGVGRGSTFSLSLPAHE